MQVHYLKLLELVWPACAILLKDSEHSNSISSLNLGLVYVTTKEKEYILYRFNLDTSRLMVPKVTMQ
jgi:hypothetical protein